MKISIAALVILIFFSILNANNFTIEVLATDQENIIDKNINILMKNGYEPELYMDKRNQYVITIGQFTRRRSAENLLKKVRKIKKKAFVRRINVTDVFCQFYILNFHEISIIENNQTMLLHNDNSR